MNATQPDAADTDAGGIPATAVRWRDRRSVRQRTLFFTLSALGIVAGLVLWATGHGGIGMRVLAGDVLMLLLVVLLAA